MNKNIKKNNNIENIKKLIEYPKKGILSKVISLNKINTTLFCMAKGTEMSEHTSTKQGFIYILEGKGTIKLGNENLEMSPGVFIYMKENAVHSLSAKKNTSFLLALANN